MHAAHDIGFSFELGGALFVVLNDMVNSRGGFLRKTATTVTYLAHRRKTRTVRMLHDLGRVPLLRDVPSECVAERRLEARAAWC